MAIDPIKRADIASMGSLMQGRAAEPSKVKAEDMEDAGTSDNSQGTPPVPANYAGSNVAGGNAAEQNGEQAKDSDAERKLKGAIQHANNQIKFSGRTTCKFAYHDETKRISIKVIDSDTKEVIREIPPEETLQMVQKVWELAGILVDEKR